MLALSPRVMDVIWQVFEPLIPPRVVAVHPLGCHRQRVADRVCFEGIVWRLATGCSWDVAARHARVGETTLRRRRDEWVAAGVFDRLVNEALHAYDRIIGFDLRDLVIDGSAHKAPIGGEGTGPNSTDRGKCGWKWSVATDRNGIPLAWTTIGANRHDYVLFEPTLKAVHARGLLLECETLHLDRGYDYVMTTKLTRLLGIDLVCERRRRWGRAGGKRPERTTLGMRWPVERTNSWLSNYGQLRRNTDRFIEHRLAQLALAITFVLTIKLIKWHDRWSI